MAGKLEAIIMDFDDTLIPTTEVTEKAMNAAIDAIILKGVDVSREELHKAYMDIRTELGSKYKKHFDVLLERMGIPKMRANELISAARRKYHLATMALMPFHYVPKTLYKLKDRNILLYIGTDGNSLDQWDKLDMCNFDKTLFDGVFITEDYQFDTKCPEFYKMILDKIEFDGKSCLSIGDKINGDIRPARACGMHTARVLTGRFNNVTYEDDADYVIPRFSDILQKIPEIEQKL